MSGAHVSFFGGQHIPLEMHRVRIVQKTSLLPVEQRLQAMTEAGNNMFLLPSKDVFMDMLINSGVNAMSDQQQAAMVIADDSYVGSATYTRLDANCVKFSAWNTSYLHTKAGLAKTS